MASMASYADSSTGLPDRISSRDDVVKCLDLVVAFYDRTEPSSPIPHLARRVRRMVHMDFVELMEDLAPSGLKEFRLLAGVPDVKKTAQILKLHRPTLYRKLRRFGLKRYSSVEE